MFFAPLSCLILASSCLTNVSEVSKAIDRFKSGATFSVTGTVIFAREQSGISQVFAIRDDTGSQCFCDKTNKALGIRPGMIVGLSGRLFATEAHPRPTADVHVLSPLGETHPPEALAIRADLFDTGIYQDKLIRLTGVVRDVGADEIDTATHFVLLDTSGVVIPLVVYDSTNRTDELRKLIGSTLSVCGICDSSRETHRRLGGYVVYLGGFDELLQARPTNDPYDVPGCENAYGLTPRAIDGFGRCKMSGRVLAVWQRQHLLLSTPDGRLSTITLAESTPPKVSCTIETAGFAATDLYRLNLTGAIWRPSTNIVTSCLVARQSHAITDINEILQFSPDGRRVINARVHGRDFHLRGTVKVLHPSSDANGTFTLAIGDARIAVDTSSVPGVLDHLVESCIVDLSGICVVNTESWQPHNTIPRTHGVTLVLRSAHDLTVVAMPPWWTRGRLLTLIAILSSLLVFIIAWNRILNRLVVRRSRQLFREKISHANAVFRTNERTRLATELHDSISQNLAAFAYELSAVRKNGQTNPSAAVKMLPTLESTLQFCRTELRQCLFDLRSNPFEEHDMSVILGKSLEQLGETTSRVRIRFPVPRSRLHDTTLHAIICIVRELVSNALRHGASTSVKVAGAVEGAILKISVTDNGIGFEVDSRPGPEAGHFGIAGIESRVQNLFGSFHLDSCPGRGTKATVNIPMPNDCTT